MIDGIDSGYPVAPRSKMAALAIAACPPAPLRVAVIGYGLAGEVFHCPLVTATPDLRLTCIVTSNEARSAAARARYPGVRVLPTSDVGRLFDAPAEDRPELVVVCAVNRAHASLALAAIR